MFSEKVFYDLSLLSYFDIKTAGGSVSDMIDEIKCNEELLKDNENNIDFQNNMKVLLQIDPKEYESMTVREYYNDNAYSGIVYYVFETEDALFFAFRGSEKLDELHHKTGWQDWKDNFRMFLKHPTPQQLLALHRVQETNINKPFYMCGHSKGGNLALFVALTMKQELLDQLINVVSFNAPGITKPILSMYDQRAHDPEFLKKLFIFENENDCISSFFESLRHPIYIQSNLPCTNLEELYYNHMLHAMSFQERANIMVEKKTVMPKFFYHFVNDFFVNLKEKRLQKVIDKMDGYFDSGCSMEELYRKIIVDISRYVSFFEDIPEEEMATVTLQDLIDRRKTKILFDKVKESSPIGKLNEISIKEITSGFIENYELLVKGKTKDLQSKIAENNEKIVQAILTIRNRENKEEKVEN